MYKAKEDRFLFVFVNTTKSTMLQSDGSQSTRKHNRCFCWSFSHTRSHFLTLSHKHRRTHTQTVNLITALKKMIFTKMASATGNRLLIHTAVFSTL